MVNWFKLSITQAGKPSDIVAILHIAKQSNSTDIEQVILESKTGEYSTNVCKKSIYSGNKFDETAANYSYSHNGFILNFDPYNFYKNGSSDADYKNNITANYQIYLFWVNTTTFTNPKACNYFQLKFTEETAIKDFLDSSYLDTYLTSLYEFYNLSQGVLDQMKNIADSLTIVKSDVFDAILTNPDSKPPNLTPLSYACFLAGSKVKTDQGLISIEELNVNVNTIDNKKILGITRTIYTGCDYLVAFEKDSLGENIPNELTVMSKEHGLYIDENLVRADYFLNNVENVFKYDYNNEILYNILLEEHEQIIVNNIKCESLKPDHKIAKLFLACKNLSLDDQNKLIEKHNKEFIQRIISLGY